MATDPAPPADAPAPMATETAAPPAALAPAPAPLAPVEPVFANPGKQVTSAIGKFAAKEPDVVLLPTMQLQWATRNEATATGGVFQKHRSTKEIFAPFDKALLERVLIALQDDLAARFEAAGWQATTRAELGADVPELQTVKVDAETGMPTYRLNLGAQDQVWVVAALPGALPPNPKSIGNGMAWNRWLKGKAGFNLNVTYLFAPGTVGETKSRMLGTEAGTGLWFSARTDLNGASTGGWGNVTVNPQGLIVAPEVGTLAEIKEGKAMQRVANVIGFLGGVGTHDKTGYNMTPDWAKVEEGMLRAGRAYNAELVAHVTARK
jgi:hypothetical protein